jgi:DNA/RNA-binding protein KIN17
VKANQVYQEFIQDKNHMHMNSTRWVTLTEFAKHLGRSGIARVDETEKGWFIAWIDNSPKALAKQEASMKKERLTTSDEQRERQLIAEQIERAKGEKGEDGERSDEPAEEERVLKRDEGEKVKLSLAAKPAAAPHSAPTSVSLTAPSSSGLKLNPLKPGNAFKRTNVFKTAASSSSASSKDPEQVIGKKRDAPLTMAEKVILEDQERKRRKMEKDGVAA